MLEEKVWSVDNIDKYNIKEGGFRLPLFLYRTLINEYINGTKPVTRDHLRWLLIHNFDVTNVDTSKIKDMSYMVANIKDFNQDVSKWDMSKVKNINYMFYNCHKFNQNINSWNLSSVVFANSFLENCQSFSQDLRTLIIGKDHRSLDVFKYNELYIKDAFKNTAIFDSKSNFIFLNKIDDFYSNPYERFISPSCFFNHFFSDNHRFFDFDYSEIKDDIIQLTSNQFTFGEFASVFNVDSSSLYMIDSDYKYFKISTDFFLILQEYKCKRFKNITLDEALTNIKIIDKTYFNMEYVSKCFRKYENKNDLINLYITGRKPANRDILRWLIVNDYDVSFVDVSKIKDFSHMFHGFSDFKSDVTRWNMSKAEDLSYLFLGVELFNQNISNWDISNVKKMNFTFHSCKYFNQPIGNWNTKSLKSLNSTFYGTVSFNHDISNWDVSNVVSMIGTFKRSAFNIDISKWDTSHVVTMREMFFFSLFNQDISSWDVSNCRNFNHMFFKFDEKNKIYFDINKLNIHNNSDTKALFFKHFIKVDPNSEQIYNKHENSYLNLLSYYPVFYFDKDNYQNMKNTFKHKNKDDYYQCAIFDINKVDTKLFYLNFVEKIVFPKKFFNSKNLYLYTSILKEENYRAYKDYEMLFLVNDNNIAVNITLYEDLKESIISFFKKNPV